MCFGVQLLSVVRTSGLMVGGHVDPSGSLQTQIDNLYRAQRGSVGVQGLGARPYVETRLAVVDYRLVRYCEGPL